MFYDNIKSKNHVMLMLKVLTNDKNVNHHHDNPNKIS